MSDPGLLSIDPELGGFDRWAFIHNQDHIRLAAKLNSLRPTANLQFQILDPVGSELDNWLLDHQRAHDDLGFFLGVTPADLQIVDFRDSRQVDAWLQLNQQEHAVFASILGI